MMLPQNLFQIKTAAFRWITCEGGMMSSNMVSGLESILCCFRLSSSIMLFLLLFISLLCSLVFVQGGSQ